MSIVKYIVTNTSKYIFEGSSGLPNARSYGNYNIMNVKIMNNINDLKFNLNHINKSDKEINIIDKNINNHK